MDQKTKQLVDEAEARAEKATEGPWLPNEYHRCVQTHSDNVRMFAVVYFGNGPRSMDEAIFIARARSDVPALCLAVLEQDKRARHAEEERDLFGKRIDELEKQLQDRTVAATAWDALAVARLRTINEQAKKISELETERDGARSWVQRMTQETRVLTCAFCGEAYPPGTPESNHEMLTTHVKFCAKHPMREVEKERNDARDGLTKLEKACEEIVNLRDECAVDPTTIVNKSLKKLDTEIVLMSVMLP